MSCNCHAEVLNNLDPLGLQIDPRCEALIKKVTPTSVTLVYRYCFPLVKKEGKGQPSVKYLSLDVCPFCGVKMDDAEKPDVPTPAQIPDVVVVKKTDISIPTPEIDAIIRDNGGYSPKLIEVLESTGRRLERDLSVTRADYLKLMLAHGKLENSVAPLKARIAELETIIRAKATLAAQDGGIGVSPLCPETGGTP